MILLFKIRRRASRAAQKKSKTPQNELFERDITGLLFLKKLGGFQFVLGVDSEWFGDGLGEV